MNAGARIIVFKWLILTYEATTITEYASCKCGNRGVGKNEKRGSG